MKFRKQNHCVYYCDYHIVLTTKYRRRVFNEGVFGYMEKCLGEIKEHYGELEIKEINHDQDHIHILISIPPKMSVGEVVRIIKLNTARGLKERFKHIQEAYWGIGGMWSDGYFVSTVGVNEEMIRKYIEHQGEQDFGRAELELG